MSKKIPKKVSKCSPEIKVVFSGLIVQKDKKKIHKDIIDTNARLKNFYSQKDIDYVDNTNINEDHLGVKKLHLNKKGNSMFARNFIRYFRSKFWGNANLNSFLEINDENKSKNQSNLKDIPCRQLHVQS